MMVGSHRGQGNNISGRKRDQVFPTEPRKDQMFISMGDVYCSSSSHVVSEYRQVEMWSGSSLGGGW